MTELSDALDDSDREVFARVASLVHLPTDYEEDDDDGELETDEDDEKDAEKRADQQLVVRAHLWWACDALVDKLLRDLADVENLGPGALVPDDVHWDELEMMYALPARFRHRYDIVFLRKFVVTAITMTARFATTWAYPATVAEEIAVSMLLSEVEFWVDTYPYDVGSAWKADLKQELFEDLDHEFLFGEPLEGFENYATWSPLGMAPMTFDDWFEPFNDESGVPAFVRVTEDDLPGH